MAAKGLQTIKVPVRVDPHFANRRDVPKALIQSSKSMLSLLKAVVDNGGKLPNKPAWLNFPDDIIHPLMYLTAHEALQRGQIILAARQLNKRLSPEVSNGVWQWKRRLKEAN